MLSIRKAAANRRNAMLSTGPRTAEGRAVARLNAVRHGLNTPVPEFLLRACAGEYKALLDHVRERVPDQDLSDLVYALAAHSRLRRHRAELMQDIVALSASPGSSMKALWDQLLKLKRLETYERKSGSHLARLLARF